METLLLSSETIAIHGLTLLSILLSFCLLWIFNRSLQTNRKKGVENIPLQQKSSPGILEIIVGNNTTAIKDLIITENCQLRTLFCIINMKGSGTIDRNERRRINKTFIKCLVEVKGDFPSAMIWLKKQFWFETCKTMKSDWKYKGMLPFSP